MQQQENRFLKHRAKKSISMPTFYSESTEDKQHKKVNLIGYLKAVCAVEYEVGKEEEGWGGKRYDWKDLGQERLPVKVIFE